MNACTDLVLYRYRYLCKKKYTVAVSNVCYTMAFLSYIAPVLYPHTYTLHPVDISLMFHYLPILYVYRKDKIFYTV